MRRSPKTRILLIWAAIIMLHANAVAADKDAFWNRIKEKYRAYTRVHQDPASGLLYVGKLADLKAEKRNKVSDVLKGMVRGVLSECGYGKAGDSGMADTSLFGGQMLYAMLDAYDTRRDPEVADWARLLFKGMKIIGTTSPVPGFIVRGPHPINPKAYYKDSSMDQHSTYCIALWRYYHCPLATEEDKAFIRDSLDKFATRIEKNNWRILTEDNSRMAHASGGDLTRIDSRAVTLLLPMIGAVADVTQKEYWKETYERFASERDGIRFKTLYPDHKGFGQNAHLLWGQQVIFRIHCWYRFEKDPNRRKAILAHAKACTENHLAQEFPPQTGKGGLFEIFKKSMLTPEEAKQLGWEHGYMPGPVQAWRHYKPEYVKLPPKLWGKIKNTCVLYPSSVFTMGVFSRDSGIEAKCAPLVEEMLNTVDVSRLSGWPYWGLIVPAWKA
ncbi:MAG: hypothetical protein GXP25_07010, partial [Planctomycetes bacterium]|nr:hypothetical protein [Planctomycetota bacterium]